MTRILITGANGQLGFELRRALAPLGEVFALTRSEMDLSDPASIHAALQRHQPAIIVNPGAYTAVDKAESEVELAMAVNARAPEIMAEWAAANDALLIHYSTDYIFNGTGERPWHEEDQPEPQSVYARSKWQGEQAIRALTQHHLIFRTSWVFGAHGNNFLKTMLRLAQEREQLNVVADQIGAPTSAALIADVTAQIISRYRLPTHKFEYGTYHLAAAGATSWHGYARHLISRAEELGFKLSLNASAVRPISTAQYPLPAKRPANSRLDCSKLIRAFGLPLPAWQDGVDHVVTQLYASTPHTVA